MYINIHDLIKGNIKISFNSEMKKKIVYYKNCIIYFLNKLIDSNVIFYCPLKCSYYG